MTNAAAPREETGMILVNVLVIVMLATLVLAMMIATEDVDSERSLRLREAARAMAIAKGGEISAVTALRRDLANDTGSDGPQDGWARIADSDARIDGGRFSFAVTDAQARFNLNNLASDETWPRATLDRIVASAGIDPAVAAAIDVHVRNSGGLDSLAALEALGVGLPVLRALARTCTVLPEPTNINIYTAPPELVQALFASEADARMVLALRERPDGLQQASLLSGQIILPPGTARTSNYFWSRAQVTIGSTRQQLTSLIQRRNLSGKPEVMVIRRWIGPAPLQAPPAPGA